jgi:light-regulated signal transduction histidine kinase (bacteriophytochrome)
MTGLHENAGGQALKEAREELEALFDFIAYGLEAPVHTIQSLAASLFEDHEDGFDELAREEARQIMLEVARLSKIVRELSEYSGIARAAVGLRLVSLDAIVEEVLRQWRSCIEANGASVTVRAPLGHAMADPFILMTVVSHLLENALKSVGQEGTPKVSIWTAPAAGTNRARLWVEDDGAGFGAEDKQRIFHLIHRPDGTAAGTGNWTGLAIVKKGMERLGGAAGAEQAANRGSLFWIEFPAPATA